MKGFEHVLEGLSGKDPDAPPLLRAKASVLHAMMESLFPESAGEELFLGFAPGRIEIAGKHTDYAGGHTIVCAIQQGFLFLARRNRTGRVRIAEDSREFEPLDFPFDSGIEPPLGQWANYPMTMAKRVAANFGTEAALSGVDMALAGDLPVGSGMSGSSALMMMCFCAICLVNRLHERRKFQENIHDGIDLAMYLACCENGQNFRQLAGGKGVGTFGGSEDHTAILNCREGTLSLYQYAPSRFKATASWPAGWGLVLAFSGVHAEKTREAMDKYNLASRRASLAVEAYNKSYAKDLRNLGEVEAETRGLAEAGWVQRLGKKGDANDLPGRVRQFLLEERQTTPRAINALLWRDLKAFGSSVSSSHRASRRLLWNIAPEVDFLQRSALELGAAGASGFGAGFGGSIFAVIESEKTAEFLAAWRWEYARRYPEREKESAFFLTSPGSGIRIWDERGPSRFVDLLFQS